MWGQNAASWNTSPAKEGLADQLVVRAYILLAFPRPSTAVTAR